MVIEMATYYCDFCGRDHYCNSRIGFEHAPMKSSWKGKNGVCLRPESERRFSEDKMAYVCGLCGKTIQHARPRMYGG
jgi:hypothetical protein